MSNLVPALSEINVPKHVNVSVSESFENLMGEIGKRSVMGYAGDVFFGTAFVQGARLQFTTAMPIPKMLDVTKIDRSRKKDGVKEVMEHSNRPQEPAHGKQIKQYLAKTACSGDKFILPAFTFNYGVGLDEEAPETNLIMFATGNDGNNSWPAILLIPHGTKLDTTDGAHRRSQIAEIFSDSKISEDQKDALRRNAVDVKIVFEDNRIDSHQDFADCGKAKAIPKSLVTTFDARDKRNYLTRELVRGVSFLGNYVDATAANVNLSAKSKMIWSMSAVRMFIAHIIENHPEPDWTEEEKTAGVADYVRHLVKHLPQLRALEVALTDTHSTITTGILRERRGGDVALRGLGMAIFARGYLHCISEKINHAEMAKKLGTVDWHVLNCERDELSSGDDFKPSVEEHSNPVWVDAIVIREATYRINSTSAVADQVWAKIKANVLGANMKAEAA